MREGFQGTRGFTLIETMIAMLLLAFIVSEMAMVDVGAKRSANLAKRITKANALAEDAVEKSRNRAYPNLQLAMADLGENCVIASNVATCTSTAPIEGLFTRQRRVTPLDAANATTTLSASGKADVIVTVTFADARGNPQRVSVGSVLTKF